VRALALAILVLVAAAGGASAAVPSDLSDDPLDRGVLLALPSVYQVTTTVRVNALHLADGRVLELPPRGRDIPERGTAVAVTPDGWLVTAGHVAAPDRDTIAKLAYQTYQAFQGRAHGDDQAAEDWVAANRAVARPGTVIRTVVTPARVDPGQADDEAFRGLETRRSERADLALVRIRALGAPAVAFDEARSTGTPIATIGFSGDDRLPMEGGAAGEPTVRRGAIRRTGALEPDTAMERPAIVISAGVRSGDSGGPVVDQEGALRGIVIQRSESGGYAETATEVRQLLQENGLDPAPGPAAAAFREGMAAFWRVDLPGAQRGFTRALQAYRGHALASRELDRAGELAGSPFALRADDRREGLLLGIGIVAIVAAAACALALARPALVRRGGPGGG
jgi:S1-C subfamily serine protease